GALIGGFSSLAFMSWLVIGAQYAIAQGKLRFQPKAVISTGCDYAFNATAKAVIIDETQEVWPLFRLSYMWYTLVGASVSIVVAVIVSLIFSSGQTEDLPHKLFSPVIHKYLSPPKEKERKHEIPIISIITADNS
ncbi:hypothetical protein J6590_103927, partial [Homalodisca vitripennis]